MSQLTEQMGPGRSAMFIAVVDWQAFWVYSLIFIFAMYSDFFFKHFMYLNYKKE